MYSKCGLPEVARIIFDWMEERDDVSWGTMMSGYAHNGLFEEILELFDKMKRENIRMNKVSAVSSSLAASELSDMEKGKEIHKCTTRYHIESDLLVATALMTMYAKCGDLEKAEEVFNGLAQRDVVAWCAIIASFVQSGSPTGALSLFRKMLHENLKPNDITLMSIIPACAEVSNMKLGRSIHCYALKTGTDTEISTGSALVSMYAKCGFFAPAVTVFHRMKKKDIVAWNALINGYAQLGYPCHVSETFYNMRISGIKPDAGTMVGLLPACAQSQDLKQGTCVHSLVVKSGFEEDIHIRNSLIDMYAKCKMLSVAEFLFNKADLDKDFVCWNTMIAGYASNGCPEKAISAFNRMKEGELQPNAVSIISVLPVVADLTALKQGMTFHGYILQRGFQSNTLVGNSLIDMYSKCKALVEACELFSELELCDTVSLNSMINVYSNAGRVQEAKKMFDAVQHKTLISWNSMIAGLSQNGLPLAALDLFREMNEKEIRMDKFSLASVISACASISDLHHGEQCFGRAVRIGLDSNPIVCAALIDLYCKCGFVDLGRRLFDSMTNPDLVSWNSMLVGYAANGHGKKALALFTEMKRVHRPNEITFMAILSGCGHCGLITEARKWFKSMEEMFKIKPGFEHYSCMVDLYSRGGFLEDAMELMEEMPYKPDAGMWSCVLRGCLSHGNKALGKKVAELVIKVEPENSSAYVQLCGVLAGLEDWQGLERVRAVMKEKNVEKNPGVSWG